MQADELFTVTIFTMDRGGQKKRTSSESYGQKATDLEASNLNQSADVHVPENTRTGFSNTITNSSNVAFNVTQSCNNGHMGYSAEQYSVLQCSGSQASPALLPQRYHPPQIFWPQQPVQSFNSTQFSAVLPPMFPSSQPIVYIPVPLPISDAVIRYVHDFQLYEFQRRYHQRQSSLTHLQLSQAPPFLPQQASLTQFADPLPTPAGISLPARRDHVQPLTPVLLSAPALEPKSSLAQSAPSLTDTITPKAPILFSTAVQNVSSTQSSKRVKYADTAPQSSLSGNFLEVPAVSCPPLTAPMAPADSPFQHKGMSALPTEPELQQQQYPMHDYEPFNNATFSSANSANLPEQLLLIEEGSVDCDVDNCNLVEDRVEHEVEMDKEGVLCTFDLGVACAIGVKDTPDANEGAGDKQLKSVVDTVSAFSSPLLIPEQTAASTAATTLIDLLEDKCQTTLAKEDNAADQKEESAPSVSAAAMPILKYPKRNRKCQQATEEEARLAASHPAASYITTIGPNPSTSSMNMNKSSTDGGSGDDHDAGNAEAWRQQVRYYWHGTLLFDPERCVQVWRGTWLGTQKTAPVAQAGGAKKKSTSAGSRSEVVEPPTEEAFVTTETTFEYMSTKVKCVHIAFLLSK